MVNWTLGTVAGTDTLAAQVGSLPVLDVLATATPDVPASIVVVTGDDQSGAAGAELPSPMTVKVVDRYGNAVPNVTVTFADDANGTLGATTVTTDAAGMASDTITLGATGTDDVTASDSDRERGRSRSRCTRPRREARAHEHAHSSITPSTPERARTPGGSYARILPHGFPRGYHDRRTRHRVRRHGFGPGGPDLRTTVQPGHVRRRLDSDRHPPRLVR